jgi:hypothetical protein
MSGIDLLWAKEVEEVVVGGGALLLGTNSPPAVGGVVGDGTATAAGGKNDKLP